MADTQEPQEVQPEEKPKSKLPFILIGFIVLLGGIGVIGYTMIAGGGENENLPQENTEELGYHYNFPEPFVNNLAPPDDQYLATANITLEIVPRSSAYSESDALEELGIEDSESKKNRMAQVKQTINEVFQTKTRTELTSPTGRDQVRNQIQLRLNAFLKRAKIKNVYLEEFIIN